jgi:hypothetical protein
MSLSGSILEAQEVPVKSWLFHMSPSRGINGSKGLDLFANETLYQLNYDPSRMLLEIIQMTRNCRDSFRKDGSGSIPPSDSDSHFRFPLLTFGSTRLEEWIWLL